MHTVNRALIFVFAFALAVPASGQAPLVVGQQGAQLVLPEGTEVPMETTSEVSSMTARVGDRFNLEVTDNVLLNGTVIIPAGTSGVGEVAHVVKKGMWGKSGKLETRILYVKVGTQQIRLNGSVGDRGKGGTAGAVASVVLLPLAGFFVTGTSAVIPSRTVAVGRLATDLPIVLASGPAAPAMIVPVPAQPTFVPVATAPATRN